MRRAKLAGGRCTNVQVYVTVPLPMKLVFILSRLFFPVSALIFPVISAISSPFLPSFAFYIPYTEPHRVYVTELRILLYLILARRFVVALRIGQIPW